MVNFLAPTFPAYAVNVGGEHKKKKAVRIWKVCRKFAQDMMCRTREREEERERERERSSAWMLT